MPEGGDLDSVDAYKYFSNRNFEGQKKKSRLQVRTEDQFSYEKYGLFKQVLPHLAESMRWISISLPKG